MALTLGTHCSLPHSQFSVPSPHQSAMDVESYPRIL